MGKYSSNSRRQAAPDRHRMPPLVRGIGCITMVLVPILAYGTAVFLVSGPGRSWPIPVTWLGTPHLPGFMFSLPGLVGFSAFLQAQNNLTANFVFAIALTGIIYGFMSIIYGYIYNMFGPPKYGPTDVPPPRVKTKKYTR
jgi:hypothetical protein